MRDKIIELLTETARLIESYLPQAESLPGPDSTPSGRAWEVRDDIRNALEWATTLPPEPVEVDPATHAIR